MICADRQALALAKNESQVPDDKYRQFLKDPFMLDSDAEVLRLANEYTQKVADGEVTSATELSHLFSVLDFLSTHGMLQTSSADLAVFFRASIEKMSANGRFVDGDFAGYISLSRFVAPVSDELKTVTGCLDAARERLNEAAYARRIENLRVEMDRDFESFVKRMTGGIDDESFDHAHEPVLTQMGACEVAGILARKHAREIRLFESMLRQRYLRVSNIRDFLSDEHGFLIDLNKRVAELLAEEKGGLRGVALAMLSNLLADAAKKIASDSHSAVSSAG